MSERNPSYSDDRDNTPSVLSQIRTLVDRVKVCTETNDRVMLGKARRQLDMLLAKHLGELVSAAEAADGLVRQVDSPNAEDRDCDRAWDDLRAALEPLEVPHVA